MELIQVPAAATLTVATMATPGGKAIWFPRRDDASQPEKGFSLRESSANPCGQGPCMAFMPTSIRTRNLLG